MARTRDVLLVLLCLGFLLIISVGQFGRIASNQANNEYLFSETDPVETISAGTDISEDGREARVAMWRERLRDFIVSTPEVEEVVQFDDIEESPLELPSVFNCSDYRAYVNPVLRLYAFESEGVRIFTDVDQPELIDSTNTFMVLPVRTGQSGGDRNCLSTDVIGIALNGSLIRNNQFATYGIFESETLIGYALDGFPIYGSIDGSLLDGCGGRMTIEGYRYHIALERQSIIQCYVAMPLALP